MGAGKKSPPYLGMIVVGAILASGAVGIYFVRRMCFMLQGLGIDLTGEVSMGLLQLQMQFLFGILALSTLLIIFLMLHRRLSNNRNYNANLDALTGALNRKAFLTACSNLLAHSRRQGEDDGYFIMLDVDWFKKINDQYGHPVGDQVLREIANQLWLVFGDYGVVGRFGGDEFAVMVPAPISKKELEENLKHLMEAIRQIDCGGLRVSCSVGISSVGTDSMDELYRRADDALYAAKQQGRGQYVFNCG